LTSPISIHPDNPHYFLYDGQPRILNAATEHYGAVLNRNFNYVSYLEEAADKQATLSRCFLLFRELEGLPWNPHSPCKPIPGEYLAPFARTGPGYATDGFLKFNLDVWDEEYFGRLHGFLAEAAKRGVVVELTLFSNAYGDPVWDLNPFNVKNNVNGVGDVAWQDYNSMSNAALFEHQLAYTRKVVREVNAHDNFYFEVCNEPFGDHMGHVNATDVEAWQAAIRATIREEEAQLPKRHLIFQVPTERPRAEGKLDPLFAEPSIDAINIHDYQKLTFRGIALQPLNQFMQRDLHLERIAYMWSICHAGGKPMVFDEDNASTNTLDVEGWTTHRKRAWVTVVSGGHYDMIDFSIQSGGQERGTPASRAHIRTWMEHLSAFMRNVDFIHAAPVRDFCAEVPAHTLAVTLANPGQEYVIYVADCRERDERGRGEPCEGTLAFTLPPGSYQLREYSPATGEYRDVEQPLDGGVVRMELRAFVEDVVLHIRAA
jgi:hypothetical protein